MEMIGYLASVFTGVSLGLMGGGGSILTVPILVYLFSVDPLSATGYSLFIVGVTSLAGVFPLYQQRAIDTRLVWLFGIPSTITVIVARKIILPAMPDVFWSFDGFAVSKPAFIMLFFALIMVTAALLMILKKQSTPGEPTAQRHDTSGLIVLESVFVGLISGISGAGGGFLIIPLLTILNKVPIKRAIGTSLLIIGVQSMSGFLAGLQAATPDWALLMKISALSVAGFFAGNLLSGSCSGRALKNTFGWFVLGIGLYIISKEITNLHAVRLP